MSKLDEYAKVVQIKQDMFMNCLRASGPFQLGPTKRGGFFFHCNNKDVKTEMSVSDLKNLRELIDDFLKNVVGEQ